MITCNATIEGVSPYSQSRAIQTPKLAQETHDDFEKRVWRERMTTTTDGHVCIQPMAFKLGLDAAAKFINRKIPGERNATYTKHFRSGVLITEPLVLPVKAEEVDGEWLFLNADGKRGGGTRVWKCMPKIPEWGGVIEYNILDPKINQDIFREVLEADGKFIGLGRFRPENGGMYGRFKVTAIKWIDEELKIAA